MHMDANCGIHYFQANNSSDLTMHFIGRLQVWNEKHQLKKSTSRVLSIFMSPLLRVWGGDTLWGPTAVGLLHLPFAWVYFDNQRNWGGAETNAEIFIVCRESQYSALFPALVAWPPPPPDCPRTWGSKDVVSPKLLPLLSCWVGKAMKEAWMHSLAMFPSSGQDCQDVENAGSCPNLADSCRQQPQGATHPRKLTQYVKLL